MVKLQQSACFLLLVTLCQSVAKYANLDRKTTKYPNPNGKGKTWPVLHCVYWMQRWFPLYHSDYQVPRAWRSQLRLFYSHIAIFISALATKIVCILEIIPIKKWDRSFMFDSCKRFPKLAIYFPNYNLKHAFNCMYMQNTIYSFKKDTFAFFLMQFFLVDNINIIS